MNTQMNFPNQFQRFNYFAESFGSSTINNQHNGIQGCYAIDPAQQIQTLTEKVEALTKTIDLLMKYISVDENSDLPCVIVSGANLHIVNDCEKEQSNGLGNLIIGNNKTRKLTNTKKNRMGSHNIVIGNYHHYEGCGSIIFGNRNTLASNYSLLGGFKNKTENEHASIISGCYLTTKGWNSGILGSQTQLYKR